MTQLPSMILLSSMIPAAFDTTIFDDTIAFDDATVPEDTIVFERPSKKQCKGTQKD